MNTDLTRIEYKFCLSAATFQAVLPEIEARLGRDRVVNAVHYPVISEYWDSPWRDIYWERVRGLSERRKFRIRIYGTEDGVIPPAAYLEVKHKSEGKGVKRRLPWEVTTLGEVQTRLGERLREGLEACPSGEGRVRREILEMVGRREMRPSCQIRYDRMAYEGGGDGEEFRVTFDTAVRCRVEAKILRPDCQDFPLPVTPEGLRIMEVKAHRTMPYWMRDLIGRHHLVPRGFSKYGAAMEMYDPELRAISRPSATHHAA